MKVPENVLKEVNDHLANGLNTLNKILSQLDEKLNEKSSELMKDGIKELKAGNKILAEYLDKFPDE